MSLINDALKRASQTTPPEAEAEFQGLEGLEPVPPAPQSTVTWPVIVFPILVFFIVALAAFFLVRGLERKGRSAEPVAAREKPSPDPTTEPVAPAATELSAVGKQPVAKQPGAPIPQSTAQPSAGTEPAPKAGAGEPGTAAPKSNAFKVQGIFYRAKKPSAMINSQTVYVGDQVGDAKVVAIDKTSVTIETPDGQKKILSLF